MQIPISLVTLTAYKPPLQIYRPRQLPSLPRPKFAPAQDVAVITCNYRRL